MNIVSSKHRLWVERHMDQANCKVGMGREKLRERENKLQLSPNISFKPKKLAWPQFYPWLDTIHDCCIFRKRKKKSIHRVRI